MIIKTKLQREWSCVCTALHMLALEGKQLFPLKAATGLSEGLFHGLHGYGQISPLPSPHTQKAPAALSLFISLGYSHKEEGKHFFGVLFSGYQVMHSNLNTCFTIAISHIQAASGTGGQVAGLGTRFPTHHWPDPGLRAQGASKTEKPTETSCPQNTSSSSLWLTNHLMVIREPQNRKGKSFFFKKKLIII